MKSYFSDLHSENPGQPASSSLRSSHEVKISMMKIRWLIFTNRLLRDSNCQGKSLLISLPHSPSFWHSRLKISNQITNDCASSQLFPLAHQTNVSYHFALKITTNIAKQFPSKSRQYKHMYPIITAAFSAHKRNNFDSLFLAMRANIAESRVALHTISYKLKFH